jgi:hypothetical protein
MLTTTGVSFLVVAPLLSAGASQSMVRQRWLDQNQKDFTITIC